MDKPKGNPLRPQTVLELLDRAFNIYRENFVIFFGLVAAVTVPITVINLGVGLWINNRMLQSGLGDVSAQSGRVDPSALSGVFTGALALIGVLVLVGIVVAIVQAVLINAILTYMTSERHLGRVASVRESFNAVRDRLSRLGVGLIFFYAIMIAVTVALAVVLFACGLGAGIIAYIYVTLYAFLTPVLILERTDLITGMKRAWMLAKARVWPVLGLMGVVAVINYIIGVAFSVTGTLIAQRTVAPASFGAGQVLDIVVQTLVSIFLAPVLPIGLTLLYYDARVRLEGLDISLQSANVPDPRPADIPSPEPPPGWFMSSDDFRNVGLFMIGGIVVLAAACGLSFLAGGATRLLF